MFSVCGLPQFRIFSVGCALFFLAAAGKVAAVQVKTGRAVTFSVNVEGTAPFSYQWLKDGANIDGANSANYAISSAQAQDDGSYSVVVSNSAGSTTSSVATVTVVAGFTIATSTAGSGGSTTMAATTQVATAGHDVTFYTASNAVGQWQASSDGGATWSDLSNGGHYSGVTTGSLSVSNVDSGLNATQYRFVSPEVTGNSFSLSVAPVIFPFPLGIAADSGGNLYVTDTATDTVQKISSGGTVTLIAGSSGQTGSSDGNGANARFNDPSGICSSSDGVIYLSDGSNGTIRSISVDGKVTTLAGSTTGRGNNNGNGTAATFSAPLGVCRDGAGNLYVADALNNTVRKITSGGAVSTLAGTAGVAGNIDGSGAAARFNHPTGVAVDTSGNVYVSDAMNNTVRRISPNGAVSTLAGLAGVSGSQDGMGSAALFNSPGGLGVDSVGNVYLADTGNSTIRKISTSGQVSTLAGLPGIAGLMDGMGSNAWFNQPKSVAVDASGNVFVADTGNAAIRKVTPTGTVSTLALSAGVSTSMASAQETTVAANSAASAAPTSIQASSSSSASSGSGGGGVMNVWFVSGLLCLVALRRKSAK